jgi:hypothetical protein
VEQMQRIETDQGELIEVFENDLDKYLHLFCSENDIDDMKKESQAVWNSCLRYIYKNVFKGKSLLKDKKLYNINNNSIMNTNYNSYDYDVVLNLLDIYVYDMCLKYDKEVSILGFSTLSGINDATIMEWRNNKSSTRSFEIYKKLNQYREESLSNKLATGNRNPVGILAILNRHYQWNLPGVSKETSNKNNLSLEDMAGKIAELTQNPNQTQYIDIKSD